MSFSKAKIQRFNDIKPCAPGPTAYNVAIKDKKKGAPPHSERFAEPKSPTISETGSTHSTPCRFRTPTLPKRKKTTSAINAQPKELFLENTHSEALKEKSVECENKDASIKDLSEQIEELKGKMSDLEKQKQQLDEDKVKLDEKMLNLKSEHEEQVKELTEKFNEDITKATEEKKKIADEMQWVRGEYEELREANKKEMEELKINCDKFHVLYNESMEECNRLIEEKNKLLKFKEEELKALEDACTDMQTKHALDIERLRKEHQTEIQDIEFEMLKNMTELQKEKENAASKIKEVEEVLMGEIRALRDSLEEEKKKVLVHTEFRIKLMEEELREMADIRLKEKIDEVENNWRNKLKTQEEESNAILKECQEISEYNIIQCELEKNEIKNALIEKTKELEDVLLKYNEVLQNYKQLSTKCTQLQSELDAVETRQTFAEELDCKNKELRKLSEEKRAYEVTIKNSQVTIEVLKRRLIHSDRDVEQLKKELTDSEEKILNYENKYLQLLADLKQAQNSSEELEMQYESAIKLNVSEIKQVKADLTNKVDSYKAEAKKVLEDNVLTIEIMQQLHEAFAMINKLNVELECLETINQQYEFERDQSQNELDDYRMREMQWNGEKEKLESAVRELQDESNDLKKQMTQLQEKSDSYFQYLEYYKSKVNEYEDELDQAGNIHKKYIEQSGKYDELLQKFEHLEMENLENKHNVVRLSKELEDKVSLEKQYEELKEAYDKLLARSEPLERKAEKLEERQLLEDRLCKAEWENETLLKRNDFLESELSEVSKKYADLAGHQNNKQKIKHLVDLKTKNEELVQTNMDLESKVCSYLKSIEKLKRENADLKKCVRKSKLHPDDKENVASPNRSLNSSRMESPFRERN